MDRAAHKAQQLVRATVVALVQARWTKAQIWARRFAGGPYAGTHALLGDLQQLRDEGDADVEGFDSLVGVDRAIAQVLDHRVAG
jgi:hypothetical protein